MSLNVSYELHRMHGTPRAAKFIEFLTTKLSPEPFLCWSALERLISEVRDNTLASYDTRAMSLKAVLEEFILDNAPQQIGLNPDVREKMKKLHLDLLNKPDFWDGRPLLTLQREVEIMLLSDLREFQEKSPWSESDLLVKKDAIRENLRVSIQPAAQASVQLAARRNIPKGAKSSSRASTTLKVGRWVFCVDSFSDGAVTLEFAARIGPSSCGVGRVDGCC